MAGICMFILVTVVLILMLVNTVLCKEGFARTGMAIFYFLLALMLVAILGDVEYRDGQIDAINGKVKYEPKTQVDTTVVWIEKEEK